MGKLAILDKVLEGLMRRYKERVPAVSAIIDKMVQEGIIRQSENIENDHIAFRTLGVPWLGIQSLEKIFLYYGYIKRDHYYFAEKKLDAWWYAPPAPQYPRIFISELRVKDLAEPVQQIIKNYTNEVTTDPVDKLDTEDGKAVDHFLHSGLWRLPSFEDYKTLAASSEYASWAIYNRYYLNHFTIAVHNLEQGYDTIESFCSFLERNGFILNDAGGKIKVSPDGGLAQASTVADYVEAEFSEGIKQMIPGSYVEFAERKVLPEFLNLPKAAIQSVHRREGFEAANADKIFESTFQSQINRK